MQTMTRLNDFVFENTTKVYFGKDQLKNLPEEIKKFGNRVMLTYGGGSIKRIGLFDKVKNVLEENGITVFEFGGIEPNPKHTTINKGIQFAKENNIEVLLAVGGGSTIDATKALSAGFYYDGDVWDLVTGKAQVVNALPIFTILTLAATGSEMDCGGVISNMETHEKLALMHPLLQPKVSFLNPENTFTVSPYQTASGSADIIAHLFDLTYFAREPKMEMLDMVMESILKTVVKYAPVAVKEPDNYEARANLMWAASWALNGFVITGWNQACTCHNIEHELSAFYDITHGHGLAILMPRWLEYILDETTAADIRKFGVNVFGLDSNSTAKDAIERLKKFLFEELGLKPTLTDLNIDKTHFKEMAEHSCFDEVMHGYRDLTPKDVEKILEMCL